MVETLAFVTVFLARGCLGFFSSVLISVSVSTLLAVTLLAVAVDTVAGRPRFLLAFLEHPILESEIPRLAAESRKACLFWLMPIFSRTSMYMLSFLPVFGIYVLANSCFDAFLHCSNGVFSIFVTLLGTVVAKPAFMIVNLK
jgi:hypothetical protein